jgi:hypothetical protein
VQLQVGSFTRDFERWIKGALEVESISMWEHYEGNLEGAPVLGTLKVM